MSLTTAHCLKTHERHYSANPLLGTLPDADANTTIAPYHPSFAQYDRTSHGAGAIALALLWLILSYSNFNGDWLQTGIPRALVHFTETPTTKP